MIFVNPTRFAFYETTYSQKNTENKPYQTVPTHKNNSFQHGDKVSFGAIPPRTRIVKKFVPSENFIAKKWLSVSIKKMLPDGKKIITDFVCMLFNFQSKLVNR